MPQTILMYLSGIAAIFCIYSATCFFTLKDHHARFLKAIGIANLLYCMLTLGLLIVYFHVLTIWAIPYFIVEILMIGGLVFIELKTAKAIEENNA